jgi:hypothetical protein
MQPPHRDPTDVAAVIDKILSEHRISVKATIAMLRQRTGTERSDADLEGLIIKKAAVRGISIIHDRDDAGST